MYFSKGENLDKSLHGQCSFVLNANTGKPALAPLVPAMTN